jgi:hypothetical protein
MSRQIFSPPVNERETRTLGPITFTNELGVPIPKSDFTVLTLTLHLDDDFTPPLAPTIINGVSDVDLLTDARGDLHATNGELKVTFTSLDNQLVDPDVATEKHVGLLEYVYGGGKRGAHEIEFTVVRIAGRTP